MDSKKFIEKWSKIFGQTWMPMMADDLKQVIEIESRISPVTDQIGEEVIRKVALEFFFYWWNAKGKNTEEAFDGWFPKFKSSHPDLFKTEWISVETLPESNVRVLARTIDGDVIRAQYAKKFTLIMSEGDDGEYDEETDETYCTEGWYETNAYEDCHWLVCDEVTHWMPLPSQPSKLK